MKLFGIGKRVLPPSSQTICGQYDGVREARSWYVDETYVKVQGKWCYLYRAIDEDGNLVDSRLSEKRDMDAAKQFFKQALEICGHAPEHITTDGHRSYPRAKHETIGNEVAHRTNKHSDESQLNSTRFASRKICLCHLQLTPSLEVVSHSAPTSYLCSCSLEQRGSIILPLYNKEGEFRQEQVLFCRSAYLLEIYLFPFR